LNLPNFSLPDQPPGGMIFLLGRFMPWSNSQKGVIHLAPGCLSIMTKHKGQHININSFAPAPGSNRATADLPLMLPWFDFFVTKWFRFAAKTW
jgi:hypothetical protein